MSESSDNRRFAVVTGATGAIGRAIANQLGAQALEVIEVDIAPPERLSANRVHFSANLTDEAETRACAQNIVERFAPLVFVHCAGATYEATLENVRDDEFGAALRLHLGAAVCFVRTMLPKMKAARYGRIVLIGSRAMLGLPARTAYSAAKAGMAGLARTWALELARYGITTNVVSPGPIETPMLRAKIPEGSASDARVRRQVPLGRLGRPEDVARAVGFFVDEDNGWITGQNLYVCGGTSVSGVWTGAGVDAGNNEHD